MTSKKDLSEQDICAIFITPAIVGAGWDLPTQIRQQVYITNGRVQVRGKLATRGPRKFADYILYRGDTPLAAKTTISGLVPGVTVLVRHRAVTKTGPDDWSQPVSLMVV